MEAVLEATSRPCRSLRCLRANFSAASLASVPLLAKNTREKPLSGHADSIFSASRTAEGGR